MLCCFQKELIRTLPINNTLLRHLQCLHPLLRKESTSRTSILCTAHPMPFLFNEEEIDRLDVEWYAYKMADISDEWMEDKASNENRSTSTVYAYHPIDMYWRHVFSIKISTGFPQFVVLTKLIKCLLSLSRGNANVERDFSENRHLVPHKRESLNRQSMDGLRATSSGIKFPSQTKSKKNA